MQLPFHVLGDHVEGVAGPHVTDGVAALVRRAVEGVGGAGAALVVGQGRVRLQSVTETEKGDTLTGKNAFSSERCRQETDHSTSKPLLAATLSGMLSVWRGSTIPRVGLMALLAIPDDQSQLRLSCTSTRCSPLSTLPVFAFRGSKSKMATPVVSLPVPAVVGTERSRMLDHMTHFRKIIKC